MICPSCESEYRDEFTRCADCDVDLVESLAALKRLAPLTLEKNGELVAELVDRLEKAAIPYAIEAGTALDLLDNPLAEIEEPDDWLARVWVASQFAAEATEILEDLQAEWVKTRALSPLAMPGVEE
jgi:hypothetical protein